MNNLIAAILENMEDGKLTLPALKPNLFAEFVASMYAGDFLHDIEQALGEDDPCTQLWVMGASLKVKSRYMPYDTKTER